MSGWQKRTFLGIGACFMVLFTLTWWLPEAFTGRGMRTLVVTIHVTCSLILGISLRENRGESLIKHVEMGLAFGTVAMGSVFLLSLSNPFRVAHLGSTIIVATVVFLTHLLTRDDQSPPNGRPPAL